MMKIKPNYNKARNTAHLALETHRIQDFPIDIISIFKSYPDVKITTYQKMAEKRGCTLEEIILFNTSEDGAIHYCGRRKRYLVAYNDAVDHRQRVYWTLGHELGHYLLKHHEESNRASLARINMSEHEYDVHEVEANFFARFFLTPPAIIAETNMTDYKKVMSYFGVSFSAATITLNYIKESLKKGWKFFIPETVKPLLSNFISKVKHGKTCARCSYFFAIKESDFCPICKGQNFIFNRKEDETLIYSQINLNEDKRPIQCPKCENENINTGEYCQVCGIYLINKCTGFNNQESFRRDEHVSWHSYGGGCGATLEGHARFCSTCGSTSTYNEDSLLETWENEKNPKKEKSEFTRDPFAAPWDNNPPF